MSFLNNYQSVQQINSPYVDKNEVTKKIFGKYKETEFFKAMKGNKTEKYYDYLSKLRKEGGKSLDKKTNDQIENMVDCTFYQSQGRFGRYVNTFTELENIASGKRKKFMIKYFLMVLGIMFVAFIGAVLLIVCLEHKSTDSVQDVFSVLTKIFIGMTLFIMFCLSLKEFFDRNDWKNGLERIENRLKNVESIYQEHYKNI